MRHHSLLTTLVGTSKLPTNPRPREIAWWFKHGRRLAKKNIPSIKSVKDFEDEWIAWWSAIQPQWRSAEGWPFKQKDATGEDWGHLLDGGKDGLFLVVVSLGWWIHAQVPSKESKVGDAIADVAWVVNNLVSCLSADATTSDSSTNNTTPSTLRQKRSERINIGHPAKRLRS